MHQSQRGYSSPNSQQPDKAHGVADLDKRKAAEDQKHRAIMVQREKEKANGPNQPR